MPEPFSRLENIYRQFPIYRFAEQKARDTYLEADWRTEEKLIEECRIRGTTTGINSGTADKGTTGNRVSTDNKETPNHREITGYRTSADDRFPAGGRNCAAPSCDRPFTGKAGR